MFQRPEVFFYPVPPLSLRAQKACNYGRLSRLAALANSQDLLGRSVEELNCTWTRMKAISNGATQAPGAGTSPHFWMCTLGGQDLALEQVWPIIQVAIGCSSAVGNKYLVNLRSAMSSAGIPDPSGHASPCKPGKGNVCMKTHRNWVITEILMSCHA